MGTTPSPWNHPTHQQHQEPKSESTLQVISISNNGDATSQPPLPTVLVLRVLCPNAGITGHCTRVLIHMVIFSPCCGSSFLVDGVSSLLVVSSSWRFAPSIIVFVLGGGRNAFKAAVGVLRLVMLLDKSELTKFGLMPGTLSPAVTISFVTKFTTLTGGSCWNAMMLGFGFRTVVKLNPKFALIKSI